MPETRSTFDVGQYLTDVDEDIATEYNEILDVAVAARDKYAKLIGLARKLKQVLVVKQTELDQQASRYHHDVAYHKACAATACDKLRAASARLRRYKGEAESLRQRNKHLSEDLRAATTKLEQAKHMCCDICMDSLKNVVTRCGHGYCSDCLATWLRRPNGDGDSDDSDMDLWTEEMETTCPTCRRIIDADGDVWPIFVENGASSSEVVCVDSDDDNK